MRQVRGIVLILFGVLALYRGASLHSGSRVWLLPALGLAALSLGIWHLITQRRTR